jgi:hypothetical protein
MPCLHKNQKFSLPTIAGNFFGVLSIISDTMPFSILGEQMIDVTNKESAKQSGTYGYKCWKDLAYDFLSHFISGVVGAIAMLWWCKQPNGQKLSHRRTATQNNLKTYSPNRSANRRLAPALC